jgi:hypothetical protein
MKRIISASLVVAFLGANLAAQGLGAVGAGGQTALRSGIEQRRIQRLAEEQAEAQFQEQRRHALAEEALLQGQIENERSALALQIQESRLAADGAKGELALTALAGVGVALVKMQDSQLALAQELREQLRQQDEVLTALLDYVKALPTAAPRAATRPALKPGVRPATSPSPPKSRQQPTPRSVPASSGWTPVAEQPSTPPVTAPAPNNTPPVADIEGFSPDHVRAELGHPSFIDNRDRWVTWYYDTPRGTTMVYFLGGRATRRMPR